VCGGVKIEYIKGVVTKTGKNFTILQCIW